MPRSRAASHRRSGSSSRHSQNRSSACTHAHSGLQCLHAVDSCRAVSLQNKITTARAEAHSPVASHVSHEFFGNFKYPVARMNILSVRLDITVKPELSLVDLKGEVGMGCLDELLLIAIPDGTCASKYELGTTQVDGLPHTTTIPHR